MANDKRYINQNRHIIGENIMKLRKRIAAMGAAMVMAVSMMSIGASASAPYTGNFSLIYGESMPTYLIKTSQNVTLKAARTGPTVTVNTSHFYRDSSTSYLEVTSTYATSGLMISNTGTSYMNFYTSVVAGSEFTISLKLKNYSGHNVSASGTLSNS